MFTPGYGMLMLKADIRNDALEQKRHKRFSRLLRKPWGSQLELFMFISLIHDIYEPSRFRYSIRLHQTDYPTDCIMGCVWPFRFYPPWVKRNPLWHTVSRNQSPRQRKRRQPTAGRNYDIPICDCCSLRALIDSDTPFCSVKIVSEYQVCSQLCNSTDATLSHSQLFNPRHFRLAHAFIFMAALYL